MIKLSAKALSRINMILGAFIAVTNGAALAMTLASDHSAFAGQIGQMALWSAAGLLVLSLSLVAMFRPQSGNAILRAQMLAVFGVVGMVALLGLAVVTRGFGSEKSFAWSGGLLSLLALYCYVLFENVTGFRGAAARMRPVIIAFVVFCIGIDIAVLSAAMRG